MKIREISKPELGELLELYRHLHTDDSPLPEENRIQLVWEEIFNNPRLMYFGAFEEKELAGTCTLSVIPNLTRSCRPYGLIENVVTHPKHRRKGIGTSILKHALSCAWKDGCYKVMLMTGRKNEDTYRFYESAGFDRHTKQGFIAKPEPVAAGQRR